MSGPGQSGQPSLPGPAPDPGQDAGGTYSDTRRPRPNGFINSRAPRYIEESGSDGEDSYDDGGEHRRSSSQGRSRRTTPASNGGPGPATSAARRSRNPQSQPHRSSSTRESDWTHRRSNSRPDTYNPERWQSHSGSSRSGFHSHFQREEMVRASHNRARPPPGPVPPTLHATPRGSAYGYGPQYYHPPPQYAMGSMPYPPPADPYLSGGFGGPHVPEEPDLPPEEFPSEAELRANYRRPTSWRPTSSAPPPTQSRVDLDVQTEPPRRRHRSRAESGVRYAPNLAPPPVALAPDPPRRDRFTRQEEEARQYQRRARNPDGIEEENERELEPASDVDEPSTSPRNNTTPRPEMPGPGARTSRPRTPAESRPAHPQRDERMFVTRDELASLIQEMSLGPERNGNPPSPQISRHSSLSVEERLAALEQNPRYTQEIARYAPSSVHSDPKLRLVQLERDMYFRMVQVSGQAFGYQQRPMIEPSYHAGYIQGIQQRRGLSRALSRRRPPRLEAVYEFDPHGHWEDEGGSGSYYDEDEDDIPRTDRRSAPSRNGARSARRGSVAETAASAPAPSHAANTARSRSRPPPSPAIQTNNTPLVGAGSQFESLTPARRGDREGSTTGSHTSHSFHGGESTPLSGSTTLPTSLSSAEDPWSAATAGQRRPHQQQRSVDELIADANELRRAAHDPARMHQRERRGRHGIEAGGRVRPTSVHDDDDGEYCEEKFVEDRARRMY